MRIALVLCVVLAPALATADARRECRFHDPKVKVTDLGCFDDIRTTEDHTYGSRLCLVRAANKCSGVMWFWEGDPEGTPVLLEDVTCRGTRIEFFGAVETGSAIQLMNFTGKIAKRVLRGSFKRGKERTTVAWKQAAAKDAFDAAARIRAVSRDVCAPGSVP